MPTYGINPYISFIENRLFPGVVQHAVFHRLTGEIIEPGERVRTVLRDVQSGSQISLSKDDLHDLSGDAVQLRQLVEKEFLIPEGHDPLASLLDQYVARPIQNPAVAYRSKSGEWILVRTLMEHTVYSRKPGELPPIIEEKLSPLTADILLLADGTRTLHQIFEALRGDANILDDAEFRTAIDFLTRQERQVIKFTLRLGDLNDPYAIVNIIPRNLYHSDRKDQPRPDSSAETIIDFHLYVIEDAAWEFDLIEPTVNHCYRFPHEALGGLDYGSRFCLATLRPEVVPLLHHSPLEVLEVGGGTGSFARAFITQATSMTNINYHILDLSPALIENQRKVLSELLPESSHFQQDATEFDLPGHSFDLIVSNEVIADFPVASVQRSSGNDAKWEGDGAYYLEKYNLSDKDAPDTFAVNAGVFRFIERAWKHLNPGGTLLVTEYGARHRYPLPSFHLNHDEFTIHFGHVASCAEKVGFQCRLLTLKEFLNFDDEVLVLNGREEHLLCLNHVFKNYGEVLPYAVISQSDFEKRCQRLVEETGLIGYSFSPLSKGYHFGPDIKDFLVLIMNKPAKIKGD